jgi:hypothetical protein
MDSPSVGEKGVLVALSITLSKFVLEFVCDKKAVTGLALMQHIRPRRSTLSGFDAG